MNYTEDDISKVSNINKGDARPTDIRTAQQILSGRKTETGEILKSNISMASEQITKDFVNNLKQMNEATKENIALLKKSNEAQGRAFDATLKQTKLDKELADFLEKYNRELRNARSVMNDTTSSLEDMEAAAASMQDLSAQADFLNNILTETSQKTSKFPKALEDLLKIIADESKERRKEAEDTHKRNVEINKGLSKTAGQDPSRATAKEWKEIGSTLRSIINTINIDQLAQTFAPNARQKLQADLQTNFNLDKKAFHEFKKDLFHQVDRGIYSSDEIIQAMGTLSSATVGNTETATKYFKDIVRGQKILGMSSQTQETLLRLGNITGKNELAFYTTQVAKFQQSSLSLNKRQLDELTQLNANMMTQAADLGIMSDEFKLMSSTEQAAFESTAAGYGSKYTQALSNLMANTDTTAAMFGMSGGQFTEYMNNGGSFTELLRNSSMSTGAGNALNVLRNGTAKQQTEAFEYAREAWGIDENTWSIFRMIAQQETELNKNLKTATEASKQSDDALEKQEKKYGDSLTWMQKIVNKIDNWWNGDQDWELLNYVESIDKSVKAISILLGVKDVFGGLSNIFGKGGATASGAGSLLSKLGVTGSGGAALSGGKALLAGGGLLAGIAGLGFGVSDALSNVKDQSVKVGWTGNKTADSLLSTGLSYERGMFMGNTYKGNENNFGAGVGNTLKWAGIGAGVGSIIPGVGTLAGALVGAGIGLIGSSIGSELEKNTEATKEQSEDLADIKKNTYETAMNTYKQGIGIVYRYRGTSNYSSATGAMGDISYSGGIGDISYPISSKYGYRGVITTTNGKKTNPFHSGTDYAAPKGTPLYSNVTGTVLAAGRDSSGANYVGVTGSDGYTHWYWHLMKSAEVRAGQKVHAGELVGYVGATGNVTGPHLHYTVTKPGARYPSVSPKNNTVDSLPFATKNIFNGSGITTESSDSGVDLSTAFKTSSTKIEMSKLGDVAGPIVGSIGDLKNTIIKLSEQTSRNQKIMDALVNRTMQSPTV